MEKKQKERAHAHAHMTARVIVGIIFTPDSLLHQPIRLYGRRCPR